MYCGMDDWDAILMDINVSLLYVSHAVMIPEMRRRKAGQYQHRFHGWKGSLSKGNVYCGSKHAVDWIRLPRNKLDESIQHTM
jgi:NADP-dependent 3-hydroxy acid dehydrogenase YdfG